IAQDGGGVRRQWQAREIESLAGARRVDVGDAGEVGGTAGRLFPGARRGFLTGGSPPPAPTVPRPRSPRRTSRMKGGSARELLQTAKRLPDALLVLDQRKAHEAFSVLPEPDTRRGGHLGLLNEE